MISADFPDSGLSEYNVSFLIYVEALCYEEIAKKFFKNVGLYYLSWLPTQSYNDRCMYSSNDPNLKDDVLMKFAPSTMQMPLDYWKTQSMDRETDRHDCIVLTGPQGSSL